MRPIEMLREAARRAYECAIRAEAGASRDDERWSDAAWAWSNCGDAAYALLKAEMRLEPRPDSDDLDGLWRQMVTLIEGETMKSPPDPDEQNGPPND